MADFPKSSRQDKAKADILTIALLLWRDPEADRLALLHIGDYAADMRLMLHVASGDAEHLQEAVALTGASAQDLVSAAVNYIEQCCKQTPANPYRILGVEPDAKPDAAKLHYRMLIKLFHPDLALIPQARAEVCAAAINQAYAQLRDGRVANVSLPAASYASRKREPVMPPSAVRRERGHADTLLAGHESGSFFRQFPVQVFFWVAAVIALLLLFLLNFNSAPMELTATAPSEFLLQASAQGVASDPVPSQLLPAAETEVSLSLPESPQVPIMPDSQSTPDLTLPFSANSAAMSAGNKAATATAKAVATIAALPMKPAKPLLQQTTLAARNTSMTVVPAAAVPEMPAVKDTPVQAISSKAAAVTSEGEDNADIEYEVAELQKSQAVLSEQHLRDLILQFVDSYNQGDIERFVGLLQPELRGTEGASSEKVREDYGKLFANSEQREIVLKDLHWDVQGNTATGLMDYKVWLKLKGSRNPSVSLGALRLEVRLVKQSARIRGFYNTPNKH